MHHKIPYYLTPTRWEYEGLTEPGVRESFLLDHARLDDPDFIEADVELLRESWMGMWRLDEDVDGGIDRERSVAAKLMLKPQREEKQLDAAEEAVTRAINLFPKKGREFWVCQSHRFLSDIYLSKGDREKAINHFEVATEIASPFNWHTELYWVHYSLAELFCNEGMFDDSNAHIGQAKSHAVGREYDLGRAAVLHAHTWYQQGKFKETRSEVLHAKDIYEKLGLATDVQYCMDFLQTIEEAEGPVSSE